MSDWTYLLYWLGAFAVTQLIEAPIYQWRCVPGRWRAALAPSALTHPVLWFALTPLWGQLRWPIADIAGIGDPARLDKPAVWLMELGICLFEGWWLRRLGGARPYLWALVGNAASYGVGELIYLWLGW